MAELSFFAHELDDAYKSPFQLPSFSPRSPCDSPLDPPPVVARHNKYMPLWQSLTSPEQVRLQSLLLSTNKSELLNVLTRLHPVHRSDVLRLLEALNRQERERLIRVLDVLEQSEQVELFGILNEYGVLEQPTILKVLYVLLVQFRAASQHAATVLSLLKGLHSLDWSKLVRLLDQLDFTHQRTLLSALEGLDSQKQHRMLEMMIFLEHKEQRQLLTVQERFPSPQKAEVLEMMVQLEHQEQRQLLRVLKGLNSPQQKKMLEMMVHQEQRRQQLLRLLNGPNCLYQCTLLIALEGLDSQEQHKMLEVLMVQLEPHEQQQLLRVLEGLPSPHKVEFLEMMVRLEHQEQRQLLRVLKGLNSPQQKKMLKMMIQLEHQEQRRQQLLRLLNGPNCHYQCTLFSALEGLDSQEQYKMLEVLMVRLEPQKQQELLRVLEGLPSPHKVEFLEMMVRLEHQEQQQLLTVLYGCHSSHGCHSFQLKVRYEQYCSQLQCEVLEIVNGLELHEQQELLSVLVSMRPLARRGVLKVMYEFHTTGSLTSNSESSSFGSVFKAPILKLLNLFQRQQPLDRSNVVEYLLNLLQSRQPFYRLNVEEYFDGLDPSEQKQLLRALDRLDPQERKQVDVFRLLIQLKEYRSLLQRLVQLFMCLLSICLSEDSQRGGFRNLLLDGWWLEFWEIILLAAGDVERNPGPRRMTAEELSNVDGQVLGKDDIFDVYDAVFDCRAKWNNLCLALRISPGDLSAVEEKRHGDVVACLRDGLSLWLQGCYDKVKYGPPTWRILVDALANSAGGDDHSLALEIAEKHRALFTVSPQVAVGSCDDRRRSEEMSRFFRNMYRSVIQLLRRVDVREVKDSLRHLTVPGRSAELCVPPQVYEFAASTKDLLDHLCPKYINPENTFILEDIVANFGSRRCKRLVQEYIDKFF